MPENLYEDKDWLYDQYVNKEKSTVEIGEKCGVAASSISYWLEKFNIESRSISESLEGRELSEETKNKISESVSEHLEENGHPFKGESHTEEAKEKMSYEKSGERNHLYGKSRPEHSERMSGSDNPSWKGGVTEEYDFRCSNKWQEFSKRVKEKADWTCENCGSHGSESELHTHHAEPIKTGGNLYDNTFIVLCKGCHRGNHYFWHSSTVNEQLSKIGGESKFRVQAD